MAYSPVDTNKAVSGNSDTGESQDNPSDETLMLAYAGGDIEAFDKLYGRHKNRLMGFIDGRVNNKALAAELFQDVWTSVIQQRSRYEPQSLFTTWLYRITRNRIIDEYRRQSGKGVSVELAELDQAGAQTDITVIQQPLEPDEVTTFAQNQEALDAAMSKLSDAHREAVLLKHIAGMTLLQIAEVTDTRAETVKSRLRYAFTQLRRYLRAEP